MAGRPLAYIVETVQQKGGTPPIEASDDVLRRALDSLRRHVREYVFMPAAIRTAFLDDLARRERSLARRVWIQRFVRGNGQKAAAIANLDLARRTIEQFKLYNSVWEAAELKEHLRFFDAESLTLAQRFAVVRDDVRNCVIAAAGSGKTRVLIERVQYLLRRARPVPPSKVLVLAFTRAAVDEIAQRLRQRKVDVRSETHPDGVFVSTIHAVALSVLGEEQGSKPNVADNSVLRRFLIEALSPESLDRDATLGRYFLVALTQFLLQDRGLGEENPDAAQWVSLRGEILKSPGEVAVADFLTAHGLRYKYEAPAWWAERDVDHRRYAPDFFLPEHGLYIEFWGGPPGPKVEYIRQILLLVSRASAHGVPARLERGILGHAWLLLDGPVAAVAAAAHFCGSAMNVVPLWVVLNRIT